MTITAVTGPNLAFGVTISSTGGDGINGADMEHNGQRAPSVFDLGTALMDPRAAYAYQPGSGVTAKTFAFFRGVGNVDAVLATANSSAFLAATTASTTVSGAFTLAAASSAGGTYSTTIVAPETGQATGTLIAIDSTAAYLPMGTDGTISLWNPGAGTGRNIVILKSSNLDAGTYTVAGRDMYGFKMTEQITASTSTNLAGVKAFKYISSITNCTTPTSTGISIGFGNVVGMPLYAPYTGQNVDIRLLASSYSSAVAVAISSANFTLGSTAAQTATTGDTRGTYSSSTAFNGTIRLQITVTPCASGVAAITSTNVAPLFGQAQYSSV